MIFSFFKLITDLHVSCLDKREKEIVTDRLDPPLISSVRRRRDHEDHNPVWYDNGMVFYSSQRRQVNTKLLSLLCIRRAMNNVRYQIPFLFSPSGVH